MKALITTCAVLALAACVTPDRQPLSRSRPPNPAELSLNYQEAIAATGNAATSAGYEISDLRVLEQVRPNYWRVRFGLAPKGSGRLLDVYFDGGRHEIVKTEEVVTSHPTP